MDDFYEDLGGDAGIADIIGNFYARVLADPVLGPFFVGADIDALARKQSLLLATIASADDHLVHVYMHHTHLHLVREKGLGAEHVARFIALLDAVLMDREIDVVVRERLAALMRRLTPHIAGC